MHDVAKDWRGARRRERGMSDRDLLSQKRSQRLVLCEGGGGEEEPRLRQRNVGIPGLRWKLGWFKRKTCRKTADGEGGYRRRGLVELLTVTGSANSPSAKVARKAF